MRFHPTHDLVPGVIASKIVVQAALYDVPLFQHGNGFRASPSNSPSRKPKPFRLALIVYE
jgi:hypothetical protein